MKAYLELGQALVTKGTWVHNERTATDCLTLPRWSMQYDVGAREFPLLTTRKINWKAAIAELLGYLRGYTSAAEFRKLGTKTWDANANENQAWLNNPHRKGVDDMGYVYGAVGRGWRKEDGSFIDQLTNIYNDLRAGKDNRGEILMFWNPAEFDKGCLRPCMYSHHFQLISDTLYLDSTQRSTDVPLGLGFNQVQVYTLLALMAQITGHKAGTAQHDLKNPHIYEDQYLLFLNEHLPRTPSDIRPQLMINPEIKTLEDVLTWVTVDDFVVANYICDYPQIKYPFTV